MNKSAYIFRLVLSFLFLFSFHSLASNEIKGVRVWPSPDSTRIVFDLEDAPQFTWFELKKPNRLVIDFKDTSDKFDWSRVESNSKLVKKIRQSKAKRKGDFRVVLELVRPLNTKVFPLTPTAPYGDRLVVDLIDDNLRNTPTKTYKVDDDRQVVIAIDAGHGGEDPGSIGQSGYYEKYITLKVAKKLKALVDREPTMSAVLIRKSDYFVNLNRRTEIARKKKVDFFVSIHADAFTSPKPNGASVWVLSEGRANSETGKWIEQREKYSELLGGAAQVIEKTDSEKFLAMTLIDMSMDHAMVSGQEAAESVIDELKKITKMHKKTPQSASLGVLKSPDIPSILVEVGFISNPAEERRMRSNAHQNKLSKAIFTGLLNYFKMNPPDGTLLAKQKIRRHRVRAGESLSLLSVRYKVSVKQLKRANNLKSDTVFVGQLLTIPTL